MAAVYRFRVTFDDNEDVYREIEIKSTQTYEDLHHAIVKSISFDGQHNASFFISDDMWRKGEEIVLNPPEDNTNKNHRTTAVAAKRLMSKCKMAALIDDPHQKFVYIYDPKTGWTFLVELVKIQDEGKKNYPDCVKSIGDAPKQYKKTTAAPVAIDDEEDDFDDDADEEAYHHAGEGHDEDDLNDLESEEGEEEAEAEEESEEQEDGDDYGFSEFENGGFDSGDND